METIDMEELKEMLINVQDSYFDFVLSMLDEAKKSEKRAKGMINYLKDNPNALTSDILEYVINDLGLYQDYMSGKYPSSHKSTVL